MIRQSHDIIWKSGIWYGPYASYKIATYLVLAKDYMYIRNYVDALYIKVCELFLLQTCAKIEKTTKLVVLAFTNIV